MYQRFPVAAPTPSRARGATISRNQVRCGTTSEDAADSLNQRAALETARCSRLPHGVDRDIPGSGFSDDSLCYRPRRVAVVVEEKVDVIGGIILGEQGQESVAQEGVGAAQAENNDSTGTGRVGWERRVAAQHG
jgi:hypothetical protein